MAERGHRFETQPPPPGTLVRGDPVRLSQILLNLLLNAATYTGDGGNIRVGTRIGPGHAEISVCDDGPGIPPERLADLFAPFTRGETLTPEGSNGLGLGLGLGLTISRRLAELHGGSLDATSAWPEPGSAFRLVLPLLRAVPAQDGPAPGETRPARPDPRARTGGPRVLVVDDNADVADALAMLLEVLGCRVATAATGAEALEHARRSRPRLALLDIGLPDMDGLELARRLRAEHPDPAALRLVAISGYGHEEARQRSREAGFDLHLPKPVSPDDLRALIDACREPADGTARDSADARG
jgi:CheY-like chemotaxis protein